MNKIRNAIKTALITIGSKIKSFFNNIRTKIKSWLDNIKNRFKSRKENNNIVSNANTQIQEDNRTTQTKQTSVFKPQENTYIYKPTDNNVNNNITANQLAENQKIKNNEDIENATFQTEKFSKIQIKTELVVTNEDIHDTARTKVTISGHERGTYLLYKPLENQIIHKQFDGTIPLEIEPYNMIILILGDFDTSEFSFEKEYEVVNSADADFLYKISVAECGRDFRFYKETDKLFNVNKEPELRDFAGDVKYETIFSTTSDADVTLDLGKVGEVAEVIVDGKSYGTKICPPYVFPLRGLQKGEHHLKIITTSHCGYKERDKFSRFVMMEPTGLLGPVKINKIK